MIALVMLVRNLPLYPQPPPASPKSKTTAPGFSFQRLSPSTSTALLHRRHARLAADPSEPPPQRGRRRLPGERRWLHPAAQAQHGIETEMPHRTRPMAAILVFTGLNVVLVSTITPVYDFVCFLPYWERRRERRRLEREAAIAKGASSSK